MNAGPRSPEDVAATRAHLEAYLDSYPGLRGRVCRVLLLHLHTAGITRIEDVYERAERRDEWHAPHDPNVPSSHLWAADEAEVINRIVIDLAARHLTPEEVDAIVWSAHQRDEAKSVEALARMPDVPLTLIARKVRQFCSLADAAGRRAEAPEGTLVALVRRFISDRVDFISRAKRFLDVGHMAWVLERVVATERGSGWVGGKAAGMVLAWAMLEHAGIEDLEVPNTVFVLTDAYAAFKEHNGLTELADFKYQPLAEIRHSHRAIQAVFQNAEFPPFVANRLRAELGRFGDVPLIVRSSSLLEDSFGAAFSGIYQSLFLTNQGPPDERLRALLGAIAEVYSGVFHPNAISYRRRHDLIDHDEQMAVMIQPVVGRPYGRLYFPAAAGVAFSRNDYRWNRRIRREDGLMRVVVGLGTRAVDRVGDFARMVALANPTMRPEVTPEEIVAASQRRVDVVDLEGGGFRSVPAAEALEGMRGHGLADFVSVVERGGHLATPVGTQVAEPAADLCITFDRILRQGAFPRQIQNVLRTLERSYKTPLDIEFAYHEGRLFLLQCRPLLGIEERARREVPSDVPKKDRVFSANRWVNSGTVDGIRYVVLIDPRDYARLPSVDRRVELAGVVSRVNEALQDQAFILMGPGRWGSQDMRLGVRVGFADICHARALIEIARSSEGLCPEPSFGTHFFQELVEAAIHYLPLYPDDDGVLFDEGFLLRSPNALDRLVPDAADAFGDVLRVIDVEAVAPGRRLCLVMDGELQEALCYLT